MKKSLIALAVLAASGAAMAQSSVTLFGIVDTGVAYVNRDGGDNSRWGVGTSGNATSRLGFRGVEDLGGGLKAGFWLEGEIFGDTGNAGGMNFKRQSTVGLGGSFGEVRLGRELTPNFRTNLKYDVFGATGIGQFMGYKDWAYNGIADSDAIRSDNMITYQTANWGGFNGQFAYGFDEKAKLANSTAGRYMGGNVAYDNGPISATVAYGQLNTQFAGVFAKRKELNVGASYNFGMAKLTGQAMQVRYNPNGMGNQKFNNYMIGVSAPVGGVGEVKAQYAYYDQKAYDAKAHQLSLGYVHNLSKRTALYGTVAYLKNKDGSSLGLNSKGLYSGTIPAGKAQTGVQVGVRHAF